jgi:hypothetical protein
MKILATIFTPWITLFILASQVLGSPSSIKDTVTVQPRRTVEAHRLHELILVDGILSEAEWQRAGICDFTQREPIEGAAPTQKTEVWVAYDDEALFVAAQLYDSSPDSIVDRIARRDASLNADWFYLGIDSYHDRRTGVFFGVYASGAVSDGSMYNDEWDDDSWDGVWESTAKINGKGWAVEMRIPYSQLRFTQQDEYTWGINFARKIERNNEEDFFVMVPKKESGWVSRFADLIGIRDIHPPARLEVMPYVVTSTTQTNQYIGSDPLNKRSRFTGNMGADLKVGLGSNLTLNATINPDFGQVELDPASVNLTQYETYYEEKRPFFVEGSNFLNYGFGGANNNWGFNFGTPNFLYTRRIGRAPEGGPRHSGYTKMPDRSHIIGAAKLTGKLDEGWSLGTIQAVTSAEYAKTDSNGVRFSDVVEPLTYYGIVRTLYEHDKGRQGLGIIGTAVVRNLNKDYLDDQFNSGSYAFGIDGWTNLDTSRIWVITGWMAGTLISGSPGRVSDVQQSYLHYFQRPDVSHVSIDANARSLGGYGGRVALNKQQGNFRFNSAFGLLSPGFDSNDLGYHSRTDVLNGHVVAGYAWYEPDGIFRSKSFNIATYRSYNFGGYKIAEGYMGFAYGSFMNYWSVDGNFSYSPACTDAYRTRGGPMMKTTPGFSANLGFSSDSRKMVTGSFYVYGSRSESGSYTVEFDPGIGFKPSAGINVKLNPYFMRSLGMAQYITTISDPMATETYGARYIFSKIDQTELAASVRLDWTFTPTLSLQLYMQPLISAVKFYGYKELKQPGTFTFNRYGEDGSTISYVDNSQEYLVDPDGAGPNSPFTFSKPDFNYISLRGNVILRWEYLPGSTMYFVWTHGGSDYASYGDFNLHRDLNNLVSTPIHEDVLLIKLTYWWHP